MKKLLGLEINMAEFNTGPAEGAALHSSDIAVSHDDMANSIRVLSMDAVQLANSGHPGMPMGMADVATVLFTRFLKFDPSDPEWADRDRFILSAGHGSMLLYSLLYLTGYPGMDLGALRRFRQLGAPSAGHPEYGHAPGIETTTGPLGQGLANGVGMALAERVLNARFGDALVDHHTYVLAGDGCLMEGISHEAISLAGHLGLGRLIVLFDDNQISIDGPTDLAVSDDQLARFAASGWHVQRVDGHDPEAVATAITAAKADARPSLIACRTIIGYGAPSKQGTAATHGAPLGEDEIAATRARLGWAHAPFEIPQPVLKAWREASASGRVQHTAWQARLAGDARANEFAAAMRGDLPAEFAERMQAYRAETAAAAPKIATRAASQSALEVINAVVPQMLGGSADLTGSNNTKTSAMRAITRTDYSGNYIHYGVREHGMAAAMNGIALHRGLIPYGGTFLVFTDYCRASIRLSSLMKQRVIYVMTHDSIGLGEDGPTHQPVEHLAALRAMPNLAVFRPADVIETAECWQAALALRETPSVLCLSRQGLPCLRSAQVADNLSAKGAYVLHEPGAGRDVTILATGSEVAIAMAAREMLAAEGLRAAVVSMPCWELFRDQPEDYRRSVLGDAPRIGIEAAVIQGWHEWLGADARFIGMSDFGASAPADQLYAHFGITAEAVAQQAREAAAQAR
jgi:transketolase